MHRLSLIISILLLGTGLWAQEGREHRFERNERVQAARVAYLTERLTLTPEQSAAFWPIFREFETARRTLRKELIKSHSVEDLTEAEAKAQLLQQLVVEEKMIALKRDYQPRFLEVLTARQLLLLPKADRDFRKEMLRMLSKRGEGRRGRG